MSLKMDANGVAFQEASAIGTAFHPLEQKGVLDRIFARLQQEQMIRINANAFSLDSTVIKIHPDGTGVLKNGP